MSWYYLKGGQQVGPVSWEDLFRAAQARQFGPPDMVWGPGLATWQPASTIPGLFSPPATPAPPVAAAPAPARPVPSGPTPGPRPVARAARPAGDDPVMRMVLPVGRSPWAIAAGYLGLFSLLLVPAPFALATGILALHDIRSDSGKHGKGRAIFGIVMGTIGTLALLGITIGLILEQS